MIHIEDQWQDNFLTAEGQLVHRQADDPFFNETRGDRYLSRSQPLLSYTLGLQGVADVVEYRRETTGVPLRGKEGLWLPCPVEYKHGKPKDGPWDQIQVCAQAICLEEMFGIKLSEGALYYRQTRRRLAVPLSSELKQQTKKMAEDMHKMFEHSYTPPAKAQKNCRSCSLYNLCLPQLAKASADVGAYINEHITGGDEK